MKILVSSFWFLISGFSLVVDATAKQITSGNQNQKLETRHYPWGISPWKQSFKTSATAFACW
jgi:hypothetical protein